MLAFKVPGVFSKMDFGWLQKFVDEYFTAPLARPGEVAPYNLVNTLVFAAIALAASYLIFRLLKKLGVRIDAQFFHSLLPFVFFGSAVRVAVDAGTLPRTVEIAGTILYPFVTPLVYVLTFLATSLCIAVALLNKNNFHSIMRAAGTILFLLVLASFAALSKNFVYFAAILGLAAAGLGAGELVSKIIEKFYGRTSRTGLERITVFAHSFDGAATLVGVSFLNYGEQHVVANALFGLGTPLLFYAVKVLFASLAVELFARELRKPEEQEQKTYLLLLVTVFGLAPGLRDAMRILAGV